MRRLLCRLRGHRYDAECRVTAEVTVFRGKCRCGETMEYEKQTEPWLIHEGTLWFEARGAKVVSMGAYRETRPDR